MNDIEEGSTVHTLIAKMNEAKIMNDRWLELYNEINDTKRELTDDDVRLLFKYIHGRILNDIVGCGLAEWWAESMLYYEVLNIDGEEELPPVEHQEDYYFDVICDELRIRRRD